MGFGRFVFLYVLPFFLNIALFFVPDWLDRLSSVGFPCCTLGITCCG
jgi:hypothetical protein